MTEPIRDCDDHGPFADQRCPVCGASGASLLSGDRRRRLSKFPSGALRHFPRDVGLDLDERGWTAFEDLAAAAARRYDWAGPREVAAVIATDPEGRFERTGPLPTSDGGADADAGRGGAGSDAGTGVADRVRASYGHSIDVSLEPTAAPIPDRLYHGTDPSKLASIRRKGLLPMSRQSVHLSGSRERARDVGGRHASDPIVIVVDAAGLLSGGHRISRRGRETYTIDSVPPDYLEIRADEGGDGRVEQAVGAGERNDEIAD